MSRRTDLLQKLFQSDKFGHDKTVEQGMMMATAELILSDLMDIAINGVEAHGPGTLIINMLIDDTVYMTGENWKPTSVSRRKTATTTRKISFWI